MNRECLQNYEAAEVERAADFRKRVIEGKFGREDIYPPRERFVKLQEPLALSGGGAYGTIWPLIPLFGSLIMPITPRPRERFSQFHGFEARDLRRLYRRIRKLGIRILAKPIYPHMFRHTRATEGSRHFTDREMMKLFGWKGAQVV